jgi:antitoxin (DNA-binding transcriptional repressor) of toxin-antitoxin stability system
MAKKMGVREFRDNFTAIVRKAKEPVIVTNHEKIVGWFTPASSPPRSIKEILATLDDVRRSTEARGVDVGARMKELGLEDEYLFEDPWVEACPSKPKAKRK